MLIVCGSGEMKLSHQLQKLLSCPAGDALILREFRSVISDTFVILLNGKL